MVMLICKLQLFLGRMVPQCLMLSAIRIPMGIEVARNTRDSVEFGGVR